MKETSGILIHGEGGVQKVIRFQIAFPLKWTKEIEIERDTRKNCEICLQQGHNRKNCLNLSSSSVFP